MSPEIYPSKEIYAFIRSLDNPLLDMDYHPGHERLLKLLSHFDLTKPSLRIRIAGTNGKGSTGLFLEQALLANGYKVGFYTSPHIFLFNERIRVNGEPISDQSFSSVLEEIIPLGKEIGLSPFELATALSLLIFNETNVDIEILECGLGAKLDATTAVPADVGLLTPVGLDHQAWLGDTLADITQDKACVFKGCSEKISAQQGEVVQNTLAEHVKYLAYAPLFSDQLSMLGEHQQVNAGLALSAIQAIHRQFFPINLDKARAAMRKLNITGRMQQIRYQTHDFYLDAAHNSHAVQALLPMLSSLEYTFDAIILCTRQDRDLSECVPWLKPFTHKMVVMTGHGAHEYATVSDALTVETEAIVSGRFLVLGSFITLGEVLRWMGKHEL